MTEAKFFKALTCEVLARPVYRAAAHSPHIVDVELLRKGLIVAALVLVPTVAIGARLQYFEVRTSGNFLFDIMVERGRMSSSEYAQAIAARPRFVP